MMSRYAYFYFMKAEPERVRAVAAGHAAHWHGLRLANYLGGPFSDGRGGLITFQTEDAAQAERAVADDPFLKEDLLEEHWLREWVVD
jgi:uncharacterized protein YciI